MHRVKTQSADNPKLQFTFQQTVDIDYCISYEVCDNTVDKFIYFTVRLPISMGMSECVL